MTLRQALYVLRRWRWIVVTGVAVGFVVGWVTAPGHPSTVTFEATRTLLLEPEARGTSTMNRAVVLATHGAVPDRVAARLKIDAHLVRSSVAVQTLPDVGELLISGRSADRGEAEALANATAEELLTELGGSKPPFRTLEPAVASPAARDDIEAPTSRLGRALLLGAFGVLVGVAGAFCVDRFDNRIRTRRGAEDVLGVPVLAEVPRIGRSVPDRTLDDPQSPVFEAYRALRPAIDQWGEPGCTDDNHKRVIVVTSTTGSEGTTTTVAHLAAALAEIGRTVLAISADLRRPQLHLYFRRGREPGLSDVLRGAPDMRRLADLNLATTIRGVRFVASGAPVRNPAPLLDKIGDHFNDARGLADFVLVDAPPLLTTSDGADLGRHADAVLLVVRAGRTSVGAATRTAELLQRLDIPLIGAVLIAGDRSAAGSYSKGFTRSSRGT